MTTLKVIRDVTTEECHWLDETVKEGTVVFRYHGYTYGCITSSGVAVSLVEGETPFFEMPRSALEVVPPAPAIPDEALRLEFDPSHKPGRENLPPHLVELMDKAFYRNRENGCNVQFINDANDKLDEFSFNTREDAEGFAKKLAAQKRAFALSA